MKGYPVSPFGPGFLFMLYCEEDELLHLTGERDAAGLHGAGYLERNMRCWEAICTAIALNPQESRLVSTRHETEGRFRCTIVGEAFARLEEAVWREGGTHGGDYSAQAARWLASKVERIIEIKKELTT